MCGIAGLFDFSSRSSAAVLGRMVDAIRHRGPDDSGSSFKQYGDAQVGLGHRRLSVIDLSPMGHQPMEYEDYEIVFNGEIYNYREIRKSLEQCGYHFRSHSDTEVILAGFHKWGMQMLSRFIGMFAFGLFDKKEQKFYLVRDRVGVKPLYYYYHSNVFLFGSELKVFHEHPGFQKCLNPNGLTNYFQFGYSICPETIFQFTYQVPPGSYIEFDIRTRTLSHTAYWKIEDHYTHKQALPETEILSELESLLISSVDYRMVADVPVGVFLSGGYDSSTVAAMLQKNRTERIKTFTIGFKEDKFDEAPHAKKIARYLGTDHIEYYCSVEDALSLVQEMPFYFDEPYADYSSIPTMLVSELARKEVTVALSADGGDELFGGYPKYLNALNYRKYRAFLPGAISKPLGSIYNFTSSSILSNSKKLTKYIGTSNKVHELIRGESVIDFARINVQQFEEESLEKLLLSGRCKQDNLFYNNAFFEAFDHLDRLLLLDFKTFLPDDLLVKIDRSTMRVSLEGREPLLDHRLIEFMGKINAQSKLNYAEKNTKYYLKKIAHKYIPEEMLNRPKMGFTPPLASWLKGPLKESVQQYLSKELIEPQGILNYQVVDRIKRDFYNLNHTKTAKKIWNILMFQMWFEKWMH